MRGKNPQDLKDFWWKAENREDFQVTGTLLCWLLCIIMIIKLC